MFDHILELFFKVQYELVVNMARFQIIQNVLFVKYALNNNCYLIEFIFQISQKHILPSSEDFQTIQQSSLSIELVTTNSEVLQQQNQQQPLKPSTKKRLHHQAKSVGQYEFKAIALNSDLTQVQEKLAALDLFGNIEISTTTIFFLPRFFF